MCPTVYPSAVREIHCQWLQNTGLEDKIHLLKERPYLQEEQELVPNSDLNLRIPNTLWSMV
jgi:hypothetical protein